MGIEIPQNKFLILDGAMGTVLQQRGLSPQGRPELLNLTEPDRPVRGQGCPAGAESGGT